MKVSELWQLCHYPDLPEQVKSLLGGDHEICPRINSSNSSYYYYEVPVEEPKWLLENETILRQLLDSSNHWEFVTLTRDGFLGFGMAPIYPRTLECGFHTTLKTKWEKIKNLGLRPSTKGICHSDYPDTAGRIHVSDCLEGDGSATRWMRLFSERYHRPQEDYCILEVDLRNTAGRKFQDFRSQHGIVIDRVDQIYACVLLDESNYTRECV